MRKMKQDHGIKTDMGFLEQSDAQRQEVERWLRGAVGGGEGRFVFDGYRGSFWDKAKVLGMHGRDGHTAM